MTSASLLWLLVAVSVGTVLPAAVSWIVGHRKHRADRIVYANRQTVAGGPGLVRWDLTRRPVADLPRARMEARLRLGSWDDWMRESQGQ
jgi:hypothetical protein